MHYFTKYWFKKGGYSLLSRVSEFLLGFLVFMMMVRIFSKEKFGVWVLFSTFTILIEIVRTNFVQNSFVKFYVSSKDADKPGVFTSALLLNIIITLFSVLLFWLASLFAGDFFEMPELNTMLQIYCLVMLFSIPFTQFVLLMQCRYDFAAILFSQLFRISLFFFFILYFFFTNTKLELSFTVIAQAIIAVLASGLAFILTKDKRELKLELSGYWFKKMFSFSKYLFGTSVVSMLSNSIDKFIMGYLLGAPNLAVFNAAQRISNTTDIPFVAVSSIVYPKGSEKLKTEGMASLKRFYEQSAGIVLSVVIPFCLVVFIFAEPIIMLTAGAGFADSAWLLRILVLSSILKPFDRQSGSFLDMIGNPGINLLTVSINFLLNSVLLYFLISRFALAGAAAGSLISLAVAVIITHIILYKKIGINPFYSFVFAFHNYYHGLSYLKLKLKTKYIALRT